MRDVGPQPVRAITLAFDEFHGTLEDEAPMAAHVAERYQAQTDRSPCLRAGIPARSAQYPRGDGSALDRWREHLVRRKGREGGRAEGCALWIGRRRAAGRLSEHPDVAPLASPLWSAGLHTGFWTSRAVDLAICVARLCPSASEGIGIARIRQQMARPLSPTAGVIPAA